MTQNVVTYTVEIATDNANGRLLPYLTANVRFELDQRTDVLLAPNEALRWIPNGDQVDPAFRDLVLQRKGKKEGRDRQTKVLQTGAQKEMKAAGTLWTLANNKARP